jgi:hypothetical protein
MRKASDGHRLDAPPKVRFAIDSPLEGGGFEPSVPAETGHRSELAIWVSAPGCTGCDVDGPLDDTEPAKRAITLLRSRTEASALQVF